MTTVPQAQPRRNSELGRFSRDITRFNVRPLWERTQEMKPGSPALPTLWRYADLRPELMRAADLITTHEAERRVLMLENPGLPGSTYITNSLYCGLQIILPGEVAPAHDHGHVGQGPVIWLDALDNPFTQFFGAIFRENYPEDKHPVTHPDGDAAARYGSALLPVDYRPDRLASPLLVYPYARTREALDRLARSAPHPVHGFKLRYANPATGGHPFPTIAVFMQLLPRGFAGLPYRCTDGTVFNVVEGTGTVTTDGDTFAFAPHDVFVVPPWSTYALQAAGDCVLFSYSDRAAQEALGFWREERRA